METYTDKDLTAVKALRHRITDLELGWFFGHNYNLMRWLRAREMNVNKAEQMLRKHLEWKSNFGINEILKTPPPNWMIRDFPFKVLGSDKDGDFAGIIPFGQWDFRTVVERGHRDEIVYYINFLVELVYSAIRAECTPDKVRAKLVLIIDLDGFAMRQILHKQTIELFLGIIQCLEDNHPEVLKVGYLINAPKIFEILWSLCKPLMTVRTLSKIDIMGCNSAIWRAKLLDTIPPATLPSQYGGANTTVPDGSFYYPRMIRMDLLKQDFRVVVETNKSYGNDELQKIHVPAGIKFDIPMTVPTTGATLRWAFRTDSNDIGFSLFDQELDKNVVEIGRADAHKNTQLGTWRCPPGSGSYLFSFDNSYSRFTPKNVYYKIVVDEPEEVDCSLFESDDPIPELDTLVM